MAKKEEKGKEKSEEQKAYEEAYNALAQETPVREVELPKLPAATGGEQRTLGEALELSEDLTDLQYAMAKLFPSVIDANATMIGRIDPNVLLAMLHLMSVNEIMSCDPKKALDVNSIYMNNYVRLTIGLDGRGRIDTAELLGAAREEKRAERMLGAGGL